MLSVPDPIDSGSTIFLTANTKDPTGAAAVPVTAYAKVICLTTGTVIRAEAPLIFTTAAIAIKTTGVENTMIDPTNKTEKKRVLFRASFGVGDDWTDYADYTVRRIDLPPA